MTETSDQPDAADQFPRHFTDVEDWSAAQLTALLDLAEEVSGDPEKWCGARPGRLLINLFYEPSTRTRLSFEIAAKRLGMHVANVSSTGSSVEKGESLEDTFHTVQAMAPDCVVLRHPDPGSARRLAGIADEAVHVINAGDGIAAHPSQALLDTLTLRQAFGDLGEVKLVMAGDIRHSRVARSAISLLTRLGIGEIRLCGPKAFVPAPASLAASDAPIAVFENLDDAVEGANAIMMLRIQKERISDIVIPGREDYHRTWGLRPEHIERAAPGCKVLHPGPMNRGVEIAPEVADGPHSLIRGQVRNGLYVRMALLLRLVAAGPPGS